VQQGSDVLEAWLKERPDDPMNSGMWLYVGSAYKGTMKDDKSALAAYIKAVEVGLLDVNGAGDVYWNIAKLSRQQGNEAQAVKYYRKVILEAAASGLAYESQIALREMGYEAPEIPSLKFFKEDGSATTQPKSESGEVN